MLDEAYHFDDWIVTVLLGLLVVLNDPANAFNVSVRMEKRIFVGDEPFGQTISCREKLYEVQERLLGLDNGLIVATKFFRHVIGENVLVRFSGKILVGCKSAVFEKAVIPHYEATFLVLNEEHQIGNMLE